MQKSGDGDPQEYWQVFRTLLITIQCLYTTCAFSLTSRSIIILVKMSRTHFIGWSFMFCQYVICKRITLGTLQFIPSPPLLAVPFSIQWALGRMHWDKLTGVTLCGTWLNAAQQCSNDQHTAYSPCGLVTAALSLTAGPILQTWGQITQSFTHYPLIY